MNDFDDIGACYAEQDFLEREYPELMELEQEIELSESDDDLLEFYDDCFY